ncbi:hypothetical protein AB8B21_04040 [Tardiphaga sp. 866_E4_N2_1]|uniref:hypothetical protein n=2 Tax=Tardiphaga TaxID=1395974 RepID=UPI003F2470E2
MAANLRRRCSARCGGECPEHRSESRVAFHTVPQRISSASNTKRNEGAMIIRNSATKQKEQIVESATEARQAEPGPSILALLTISLGLAVLILGVVWFVFFRT